MKTLLFSSLLLAGCATNIPVPPLPPGHPAQSDSASASAPSLQPYLTQHRASAPKEEAVDHSKMKMEGM
ncbi:MAG: hypothetical protein ABIT76_14760 [Chthoniobacterales bacterium]